MVFFLLRRCFVKREQPLVLPGEVQIAKERFQRRCAAVGIGILIFGRGMTGMRVLPSAEEIRLFLGKERFDPGGGFGLRAGIDLRDGPLVQTVHMRL